jgi:hypothetical protein
MAETQARPITGTFVWNELRTHDANTARSLLSNLFGWKPNEMEMAGGGKYTVFKIGEQQVAGCYDCTNTPHESMPTHWQGYVSVTNADVTTKTAQRLGMKISVAPTDIPDVGRFAVFEHPAIGAVAILEPKRG